jgi:adenylosuccinate synthase
MRTTAIIGAMYGDEGKGLTTDFIAKRNVDDYLTRDGLVVRFNGGAQAGHTVVTPDGRRHVFKHHGSGTFVNVPTFLSRFFICNPILATAERTALSALGVTPHLIVDENCIVTTPWDMLLNQAIEATRGHKRHGSCGVGINETCVREENGFSLKVKDLCNLSDTSRILLDAMSYYEGRMSFANDAIPEIAAIKRAMNNPILFTDFINTCSAFVRMITMVPSMPLLKKFIIFEGAQGLLLDQNHSNYPHVTRSNTGIKNVLELLDEASMDLDELIYVTRCYTTRHGAGPLMHEDADMRFEDDTNIDNQYQGSLRYAPLDIDSFYAATGADSQCVSIDPKIMLTHCDQIIDDKLKMAVDGEVVEGDLQELVSMVNFASYGPTRDDVKVL